MTAEHKACAFCSRPDSFPAKMVVRNFAWHLCTCLMAISGALAQQAVQNVCFSDPSAASCRNADAFYTRIMIEMDLRTVCEAEPRLSGCRRVLNTLRSRSASDSLANSGRCLLQSVLASPRRAGLLSSAGYSADYSYSYLRALRSIRTQCLAGSASGVYCQGWSLLSSICSEEVGSISCKCCPADEADFCR